MEIVVELVSQGLLLLPYAFWLQTRRRDKSAFICTCCIHEDRLVLNWVTWVHRCQDSLSNCYRSFQGMLSHKKKWYLSLLIFFYTNNAQKVVEQKIMYTYIHFGLLHLKLPSLFAAWLFWTFHNKSHNMKAFVILNHSWLPLLQQWQN